MNLKLLLAIFVVLACHQTFAEERKNSVDTFMLSTVATEVDERITVESLVIRRTSADEIAWQLLTDSRQEGKVAFSSEEFGRFVNRLATELNAHKDESQPQVTQFLVTLLSKGEVVTSKVVGESFFNHKLPSSVIAKRILDDVMRSKGMKNFYIHSYLTTAYPFENAAIGWVYESENRLSAPDGSIHKMDGS